ncbi:MAG TPA: hypothetical protein VIR45_02065 [Kiloniellaceae bacterium]
MPLRVMQFLAIVFTALALVPAGAHLFELPAKISLTREDYFIVQEIYSGWALFGFVLVSAITANLVLTVMLQGRGVHFSLACAAFLLVTTTLVVFFTAAYPANQETQNWTVMANDWRLLRKQWEYSHAINAVLTFLALCALTLEAVLPHRHPRA